MCGVFGQVLHTVNNRWPFTMFCAGAGIKKPWAIEQYPKNPHDTMEGLTC